MTPEVFDKFLTDMLPLLFSRCTKPQAHCYVFCDIRDWKDVFAAGMAAGWDVWRFPLIWDKGNVGSYGNAAQGPRHCYDAIVYMWKGGRKPLQFSRDVLPYTNQTSLPHPASKPIPLLLDLLHRSANPGDRILDPMVGGGTFFSACEEARTIGVGVELVEKYYHMAFEVVSEIGR